MCSISPNCSFESYPDAELRAGEARKVAEQNVLEIDLRFSAIDVTEIWCRLGLGGAPQGPYLSARSREREEACLRRRIQLAKFVLVAGKQCLYRVRPVR